MTFAALSISHEDRKEGAHQRSLDADEDRKSGIDEITNEIAASYPDVLKEVCYILEQNCFAEAVATLYASGRRESIGEILVKRIETEIELTATARWAEEQAKAEAGKWDGAEEKHFGREFW